MRNGVLGLPQIERRNAEDVLSNLPSVTRIHGLNYDLNPDRCEQIVNNNNDNNNVESGNYGVVQKLELPTEESTFREWFDSGGYFGETQTRLNPPPPQTIRLAVKIVAGSLSQAVEREYSTFRQIEECLYTVKLLGFVLGSSAYFFMEYLSTSCYNYYKQLKKAKKEVSECEVKSIAFSTVCALQFLKDKNLMHRDVKPSNILLGDQGQIKLCDFGISRPLHNGCASYTEIGTKSYLPPERCRLSFVYRNEQVPEKLPYEYSSDVWCLGVTLIEVAQMFHPYNNDLMDNRTLSNSNPSSSHSANQQDLTDWDQSIYKILSETGPQLHGHHWSDSFRSLVDCCVKPNPSDRPIYSQLLAEFPFLNSIHRRFVDQEAHRSQEISNKVKFLIERRKQQDDELPK